MSVLFTFPGQGAQRPAMLRTLGDDPQIRTTLDEARDALGEDPRDWDSAEALRTGRCVQLCLLVAGVATARALIARGARPRFAAGLSIGAFAAAHIAGSLDFADALALVDLRGRSMDRSFPSGYGMAAIVGLEAFQVEAIVAAIHAPSSPVYVANLNAERQIVVAGADAALDAVMRAALSRGAGSVERLCVSVPSHCPLMDGVAAELSRAFVAVSLKPPSLIYLSSNSARALVDPARIADDLAGNVARRVHWRDTIRLAWERGARLAVEMPAGSVLTRLTEHEFVDGLAIACESTPLEDVAERVRREGQ